MTETPDVVCTLTTKELADRILTWGEAATLAVRTVATEHGAEAAYPLEYADQIEDLARQECDCCGTWLDIETQRTDAELVLTMTTANPEGLDLVRRMVGVTS